MTGAGNLKHYVELWQNVQTQDPETGDLIDHWSVASSVWAEINSIRTDVLFESGAQFDRSYAQAYIRDRIPTVFYSRLILRYDGRNWDINGQMPANDRRYVILVLETLEDAPALPPDQNTQVKRRWHEREAKRRKAQTE